MTEKIRPSENFDYVTRAADSIRIALEKTGATCDQGNTSTGGIYIDFEGGDLMYSSEVEDLITDAELPKTLKITYDKLSTITIEIDTKSVNWQLESSWHTVFNQRRSWHLPRPETNVSGNAR